MPVTSLNPTPTLLAVMAHPDDESFGIGGTLAYYARHGAKVYLITATSGEVGTVSQEHLGGFASIAELRTEKELYCAARVLGLTDVFLLGYRDSGMPGAPENQHPQALVQAPVKEVAARIAHCIRHLRPQVILTHDTIGGYKHPDHIAVNKATVQAFHLAGDPEVALDEMPSYQPAKLYYSTFPLGFFRIIVRLLPLFGVNPRRWGRNNDIDLVDLVSEDPFPTHAVIDYREVAHIKQKASACHASQLESGPPHQGIFNLLLRLAWRKDRFTRVYPAAGHGLRETDLFAGIPGITSPNEKKPRG